MAIEAPLSRYKRTNFLIGIVLCAGLALWCAYDGYFSPTFKETHPQWWRTNRVAPFILGPVALIIAAWWLGIRNRKVVADENELIVSAKTRIPYDAIEKIDKTYFERKGFFVITYKRPNGAEAHWKLSDHVYDNLPAILDHLIAKIT
jgi:hypothetical protein